MITSADAGEQHGLLSATGLLWSQGAELLISVSIRPLLLRTGFCGEFSKTGTQQRLAQSVHRQVICLCTQLQIRHVMVVVITGSNPAAITVGIFHSA